MRQCRRRRRIDGHGSSYRKRLTLALGPAMLMIMGQRAELRGGLIARPATFTRLRR